MQNDGKRDIKRYLIMVCLLLSVATVIFFAFYFLSEVNSFLLFCFIFGGAAVIGLCLQLSYPKNDDAEGHRALLRFLLYIYIFALFLYAITIPSVHYTNEAAKATARKERLLSILPILAYAVIALFFVFTHSVARKLNKSFIHSKWYCAIVATLAFTIPVATILIYAGFNLAFDGLILLIPSVSGMLPYAVYCIEQSRQSKKLSLTKTNEE